MSKLVMNIKNESNLKAMVQWCEQYHIAYQIIDDSNNMPNLVDESTSTPTVSEPKQYIPTTATDDVTVTVTSKDNAIMVPYCGKAVNSVIASRLHDAGFKWDKDYVLDDTYAKDYKDREGKMHLAGSHKTGAWTLCKGSKRDVAGCKKWFAENSTMVITADEINAVRAKWAIKSARKNARA